MGDGTYDATLDAGWCVGPVINGGYLLTAGVRALSQDLGPKGFPDPVSVSGHFLSGARPGAVTTHVDVLRTGQALAFASAKVCQASTERLRITAAMGDLATMEGEARTLAKPPALPPPDRCFGNEDTPDDVLKQIPMLQQFDLRMDPATTGFAIGRPTGRGRIQGWLRLPDDIPLSTLILPLAADVLPPATLDLGIPGWTRSVEMTVQIRQVPEPGWLRVVHAARLVAHGYVEEDAEVWDSADRLVAQSRQLARLAPTRGAK